MEHGWSDVHSKVAYVHKELAKNEEVSANFCRPSGHTGEPLNRVGLGIPPGNVNQYFALVKFGRRDLGRRLFHLYEVKVAWL